MGRVCRLSKGTNSERAWVSLDIAGSSPSGHPGVRKRPGRDQRRTGVTKASGRTELREERAQSPEDSEGPWGRGREEEGLKASIRRRRK